MCSQSERFQCSVCGEVCSSAVNRIIVDACGHRKCRKCLIAEDNGCSICRLREAKATDESQTERATTEMHPSAPPSRSNYAHITVQRDNKGKAITYTCSICEKTFASRNNQKYHLYCDRKQRKPFECDQCRKQFITQSHLNYHVKTHRGDKHTCNICNRIFAGENGLRKHSRKHSNEMSYACSVCDQKFMYKEQLNSHENQHKNKYFKCGECGKSFLVKSNFTKHLLRHSGEFELEVRHFPLNFIPHVNPLRQELRSVPHLQ